MNRPISFGPARFQVGPTIYINEYLLGERLTTQNEYDVGCFAPRSLALSLDAEKLEGEQNAECHFLEDIPASACHTKVPIDAFDLVSQQISYLSPSP